MRRTVSLVALSLAVLASAHAAWLDPKNPDLTLEQKMAVINAGGHLVDRDDVTVTRFRFLMSSIEQASGVDRKKAADMIATGKDMLKNDFGKPVGLLDITEAVYRAQALLPGTPLAEIVAVTVETMGTR